ncbi:TnsA endonuclease N-terminal domain-containing protein [Clostridium perfringens]|uniref:TnsA endonuclease N-terminal domain-containing protein n=1 Tax=Clostridium perfringens TaxID=1502 RepID=UPI001F2CC0B3|nr:TnsA endonuclease N-terminal domain-containing protein [Clostridium perfringens]MDK0574163.1 TnsA endonuclease N-terminal domain-containing protein [Clostridium perfringens]MDM0537752.1 TnsA endonuclease N-terminal domain-containing protein [Clostridium perfringens]UBL01209.1 TnsA endonuclease N-terminal domain-containing protein [Clostridium perfringens]
MERNVKVTTFSSRGRVTRIYGVKSKKIHHLQSDNQLRLFLILEWNRNVIEINENVKLNDLLIYVDNVENLKLNKFMNKENKQLYDLHTNFLIKVRKNNTVEQVAISVKNSGELKRNITIEKLEIERRYWENRGIKFYLVTDRELNKIFADNILWVREALFDNRKIKNKEELADELYWVLKNSVDLRIDLVIKNYEKIIDEGSGIGLYLLRYLIASKQIAINMGKKLDLKAKISESLMFN